MSSIEPKFVVITNSIRRGLDLVEKSLRSSLTQAHVQQVVFVDQNLKPLLISPEILQNPKLKVISAAVPAVSQARNQATYLESADWLIFCDDDGYMDVGYTERLLSVIRNNPDVEVIAGSIKRIDTSDFYSKRHALGGDLNQFWNTKLLMGSNFAVKRHVFEALGRFDPEFGAGARFGSSEETDFAWNAFFHRKKMLYAPELIVFHVPPFSGELVAELKKAYRYGRGKSALIRKWFLRGHPIVLLEFFEMFLVPWVRVLQFTIKGQFKEVLVQFFAMFGRFFGLFY